MELDFFRIKKVFFIGIGGIGISALAKMFLSFGVEVAGVNDEESPKTLDSLRKARAKISLERKITEADLYIYSDAWLYRGPELIQDAKETGKPVKSFFEALGEISKKYKVIAVSGTHGKTTTTAMIAEVLFEAGFDPTVLLGSFIQKFDSNFRKGESEYLVVEADEYNRHFLNFHPYLGVVTNIETDHLDCYKNLEEIKKAFQQFLAQSEKTVTDYSKYLTKVPKLLVPGEHNRQNAATALAVAEILAVPEEKALKALKNFSGTWRRLEKIKETKAGAIVYDDYAHHPTEIRASLQALRELYPGGQKKITVVFQPHLYSRTKALFTDFAKSFVGVDQLILLPIYFAREKKDESISSGKLEEAILKNGQKAIAFTDFELAENYLKGQSFGKDDIFVTMGAGEAYKITDQLYG